MDTTFKLAVAQWCAWEEYPEQSPVCSFYDGSTILSEAVEKPDLAKVPAMQRRRLGALARVVFHVLARCADTQAQEPVVFSSYMGEIKRTQGILNSLAAQQPVSPMSFSLSVHNAIAGQWSVIYGVHAPMQALAPPTNSPVPALLEAAGILSEGIYPVVNVVFYEEDYPDFYAPYLLGPPAPQALALRVFASNNDSTTDTIRLSLKQLPAAPQSPEVVDNQFALLNILAGSQRESIFSESQCRWHLERSA